MDKELAQLALDALNTLMAEVRGKSATNWQLVNDACIALAQEIKKGE